MPPGTLFYKLIEADGLTRSRSLEEACDRLACLPRQLASTPLPPSNNASEPSTPSVAALHSAVESVVAASPVNSSPYLAEAELHASEPERLHFLGRALEVSRQCASETCGA